MSGRPDMQATAVVFTAAHEVAVQPVQCPEPGAEDVVIRVTHSWISNGTEGSFLRGERIAGDTPRRSGDPVPFPIVAGYQKIGVVEWRSATPSPTWQLVRPSSSPPAKWTACSALDSVNLYQDSTVVI